MTKLRMRRKALVIWKTYEFEIRLFALCGGGFLIWGVLTMLVAAYTIHP